MCLGDEPTEVAAPDVGLHHDPTLAVLAADLVQSLRERKLGQGSQGHAQPRLTVHWGEHDRQRPDRVDIVAQRVRHADNDLEPAIALKDQSGLASTKSRSDRIRNLLDGKAVSCDGVAVELHVQDREALRLFDLDVRRPPDGLEGFCNLLGGWSKYIEIVAIELDGDIRANARYQFVETQLDRLAEFKGVPDFTGDRGLNLRNELLLTDFLRPLVLRLQDDESVRDVDGHRIGRNFRCPSLRHDAFDFRQLCDGAFNSLLHVE